MIAVELVIAERSACFQLQRIEKEVKLQLQVRGREVNRDPGGGLIILSEFNQKLRRWRAGQLHHLTSCCSTARFLKWPSGPSGPLVRLHCAVSHVHSCVRPCALPSLNGRNQRGYRKSSVLSFQVFKLFHDCCGRTHSANCAQLQLKSSRTALIYISSHAET